MADIEKIIKSAVEANKAVLGSDEALRALKAGEISAAVVASNCPEDVVEKTEHYASILGIVVHRFPLSSKELGSICRKPFSVAVLGIKK